MNEEFLSFLWKYRLYDTDNMVSDGENIEIIHSGDRNCDSGPDFFNARIKIGDTVWVGNAEIHVKASDWNRHNHDQNQAFDNVILHVVYHNDVQVHTSKGVKVPTVQLKFDIHYLENYNSLISSRQGVACGDRLSNIDSFILSSWLSKMAIERLETKTETINDYLLYNANNWEEAFYRQMCRSFGFHVNSYPFEALAKATPYLVVQKHAHNIFQLEALLFGQAGFLMNDYSNDIYYNKLKTEYDFLHAKYTLNPIDVHLWKFMRLRPVNFPTVRIAQLAALINRNSSLFSQLLDTETLSSIYNILICNLSDYWDTHFTFEKTSKYRPKTLGTESAKIITINTIVPFFFVYGKMLGKADIQDKALQLLELIEAEQNSEIRNWQKVGLIPKNAFESQALLHLATNYCAKKRCVECGIGSRIICDMAT